MPGFSAIEFVKQTPTNLHPCTDCHTCSTRKVCQVMALEEELPETSHHYLFHSRVINAGKHLFHAGEKLDALYVVKSGAFKTYITSESGEESINGFCMPGDILGADAIADHQHESSAMALCTSAVCAVPVKWLETEVKRYASGWLLKQTCRGVMHDSLAFLISIRNHASAYAKLAYFLLKLSHQHKMRGHSERAFRLEMRRQDIANYLGLTIETVSRVLTQLHESHVLAIHGREVTIIDFEQLRAMRDIRETRPTATAKTKKSRWQNHP